MRSCKKIFFYPPPYQKIIVTLQQFLEKLNDRLIVIAFFKYLEKAIRKYSGVCENPGFFVTVSVHFFLEF